MQFRLLYIETDHLQETKEFYGGVLELKIIEESSTHVHFSLPHSILGFYLSVNRAPQYHIAYNIPSNLPIQALAWLKERTEIIPIDDKNEMADFVNWNAKAMYFFDNNKNVLEFIARSDLQNPSQQPFAADAILSLSEIGIVTGNVKETCEHFIKTYALDYFSRQPPTKDFAAIGDDEGLFIVVSENRAWYPTKLLSAKHWLKTVLVHDAQTISLELNRP
jgi:catechol-2,3-dioxygenase